MKKFLKLTTVVVSMVMALTFVSCANGNTSNNGNENSNENTSNNGNENSNANEEELNLVGTYGLSKIETLYKKSSEIESSITMTMQTSTSLRQYRTDKIKDSETTSVIESEIDVTITKTADGYSFNWAKYNINGEAASEDAKNALVKQVTNDSWNKMTALFTMTYTTTADGKWSDNNTPASSGTYTVDEANSKVTIKTLIKGEETLAEPEIMEATYSDNGKTLLVVEENSCEDETTKTTMTLTRK